MKNKISLAGICCLSVLTACVPPRSFAPVQDATQKPGSSANASPYHVVRRGDTLYSIAWAYELDYRTLAAMNGLEAPYAIHVGQNIRVVKDGQVIATKSGRHYGMQVGPTSQVPLIGDSSESGGTLPQPKPVTLREEPVIQERPRANPGPVQTSVKPLVSQQRGGLAWSWPTQGKVINRYSAIQGHKGIDISGQTGQAIYASAKGTVAYAGNGLKGYGNLIILKHNSQYLSAYAHNSELLVKEGQKVEKGQVIAKMGNTESALTKLHFEIRRSGGTTDPLGYLPKG